METAKVDIRKLQLLNDRINQCIDALSQVRLSVHGLTNAPSPAFGVGGIGQGFGQSPVSPLGLSHTSPFQTPFFSPGIGGMMPQGIPQQQFGASPFGLGFGQQSPFGQQLPITQNPWIQPLTPGLSHSTGAWAPAGFGQGVNPFAQQFAQQGVNPYAGISPFGEGLESYGRTGAVDPLLTARIAQTFPYAQYPAPPVISLY